MTFSTTSAFWSARVASNPTSDRPPALPFSLWQPTQYCLVRSGAGAAAGCGATLLAAALWATAIAGFGKGCFAAGV